MNLGWGPQGHGPYLVRQEGYAPDSVNFHPQRFILQRDGCWLLNLAFVMLPEPEQESQLFNHLTEVLVLLDALSDKPVAADGILPKGSSAEEIMAHFEQCTHRILRGMQSCTTTPSGQECPSQLRL